jgi:hypothetical protein
MRNIPTIPMDFTYGEKSSHYDTNPYHIIDGNWGGLIAPQIWFRGVDKENIENVFELSEKVDEENKLIKRWYHRVWDNRKEIWRNLTDEEKVKFVLPDREYVDYLSKVFTEIKMSQFKKKIIFPTFPLHSEIMGVQPMNGPTGSVWYYNKK